MDIPSVGPQKVMRLFALINNYGLETALTSHKIYQLDGFGKETSIRIEKTFRNFDSLSQPYMEELEKLDKLNGKFITYWDEGYPDLLKNIFAPPLILYYIGDLSLVNSKIVAIVGTRHPTNYGKRMAERFSSELTNAGVKIISGLARGIDSTAHKSCLKQGGKTIAVTGSGLDVVYPPENKELYSEIEKNGLILTEYPIGTKPDAQNFPRRNRIISGLSLGVLIVETRVQGGAMHTAQYALDQGKEVFAIPGSLETSNSEGTNFLIKNASAKLVQTPQDILNELNITSTKTKEAPKKPDLNLFEQKLFDVLDKEPVHIDKIAEMSGMSTSDCLVHLLSLEFKGVIRQYPGKLFGLI